MKQQVQQPAPVSRTLQGKAKASSQASVSDVLQAYKNGIFQRQVVDEDELLQGKFETTQRDELDDDELLQGKLETAHRDELEDNELLQGKFETVQRDELEDDELLQGKFETTQRDELEDDELLQGKFETAQRDELEDDELLQGKFETAQRDELEDDELLQGKFETAQRKVAPNNTGLPDNLKAGVEQLSGLDMSDVKVHYNSSKPASVQAYAYTQGTDIHVAPGQEKHLGHEVWHVAQQKQGRVQPTTSVGGTPVNDNAGLENEADVMGRELYHEVHSESTQTPSSLSQLKIIQKSGEKDAIIITNYGNEKEKKTMKRGNYRDDIIKTEGESAMRLKAFRLYFNENKSPNDDWNKIWNEVEKMQKENNIYDINTDFLLGYAAQLIGIGNCGEFSAAILGELMCNTQGQFISKCIVKDNLDSSIDHNFILTSQMKLCGADFFANGANIIVVDGWANIDPMSLNDYVEKSKDILGFQILKSEIRLLYSIEANKKNPIEKFEGELKKIELKTSFENWYRTFFLKEDKYRDSIDAVNKMIDSAKVNTNHPGLFPILKTKTVEPPANYNYYDSE